MARAECRISTHNFLCFSVCVCACVFLPSSARLPDRGAVWGVCTKRTWLRKRAGRRGVWASLHVQPRAAALKGKKAAKQRHGVGVLRLTRRVNASKEHLVRSERILATCLWISSFLCSSVYFKLRNPTQPLSVLTLRPFRHVISLCIRLRTLKCKQQHLQGGSSSFSAEGTLLASPCWSTSRTGSGTSRGSLKPTCLLLDQMNILGSTVCLFRF